MTWLQINAIMLKRIAPDRSNSPGWTRGSRLSLQSTVTVSAAAWNWRCGAISEWPLAASLRRATKYRDPEPTGV